MGVHDQFQFPKNAIIIIIIIIILLLTTCGILLD
jgi:hypothetical protein